MPRRKPRMPDETMKGLCEWCGQEVALHEVGPPHGRRIRLCRGCLKDNRELEDQRTNDRQSTDEA